MIKYYNRKKEKYEIENIAGEKILRWTYESPVGKTFLELFIKRKVVSKVYGMYCNSKLSRKKINGFINDFDIDMSRFKNKENEYKSFNEFFYRGIGKDKLIFNKDKEVFISPADSKLLALNISSKKNIINIKGFDYSIEELLGDAKLAKEYEGGLSLIFRLCPTDYHRFHFIDNGICLKTKKIKGKYYSVNPIALEKIDRIFIENKREYSIFKSDNFKEIVYMEVGATCVGSIIQTYKENSKICKGEEKGYFKFGGSTVILLVKKDIITIDEDIKEQSEKGIETSVDIGERIGTIKKMHH